MNASLQEETDLISRVKNQFISEVHSFFLLMCQLHENITWTLKTCINISVSQKTHFEFSLVSYSLWPPWTIQSMEFSRPEYWTHWTQVSCIAGRFLTSWATKEAQAYWSGWAVPSPADLPDPGIEPGSPALQVDSLPTEISGKPTDAVQESLFCKNFSVISENQCREQSRRIKIHFVCMEITVTPHDLKTC